MAAVACFLLTNKPKNRVVWTHLLLASFLYINLKNISREIESIAYRRKNHVCKLRVVLRSRVLPNRTRTASITSSSEARAFFFWSPERDALHTLITLSLIHI